jgi:hypothetical protein
MFTKEEAKSASKDRTCFQQKRLSPNVKTIHLALEVNTFLGSSKPGMGPSTESNPQWSKPPTDSHRRHHRKREEDHLHKKGYKAKLEQLRLARLTRHDQAVTL